MEENKNEGFGEGLQDGYVQEETAATEADVFGQSSGMETFSQSNMAAFDAPSINFFTGLIGALIGVAIGMVLWVVIYRLGYIAGIAGFVMMICSIKGFELLGRGLNIPAIILCVVLDLVAVYFAQNIAVAVEIMVQMKGLMTNLTFPDAYKMISNFMKMDDFKSAYIQDMVLGYVLTIIAIVPSLKGFVKK